MWLLGIELRTSGIPIHLRLHNGLVLRTSIFVLEAFLISLALQSMIPIHPVAFFTAITSSVRI
jgi:sRNA-binding regulator protein Hfq